MSGLTEKTLSGVLYGVFRESNTDFSTFYKENMTCHKMHKEKVFCLCKVLFCYHMTKKDLTRTDKL